MADDQVKKVPDGAVLAWEDVLTRILRMADVPKRSAITTPEWLKYDKAICTVNSTKDLKSDDKERYFFHRSTMSVTNNNQRVGDVGFGEDSHHKAWTYVRVEIPYQSNDASKQYGNWIAIEPSKTELDPAKTDEARLAFKSIGDLADEIWVNIEKAIKDIESDKAEFKGSSAQAYARDLNEIKYSFANVAFRITHTDTRDSHGWVGSHWLETLRVLSEAQTAFLNVVSKCRENLAAAAYHDPKVVLKHILDQIQRQATGDWTRWSTARPEAGWNITVTLPDNPPTGISPTSVTFDMLTSSGWEQVDKFAKTVWNAAVRQACDDEIQKAVPALRLAFKNAQESLSSLTPPGFTPTTKFADGSGVDGSDKDGTDDTDWLKKLLGDNKDDKAGDEKDDGWPKFDDKDVGGPGGPGDANNKWPNFDDQKAGDSGSPTGAGGPSPFDDLPVGDSAGDMDTGGPSPLGDSPVGDLPLGDLPVGDSAERTPDSPWEYPVSGAPPLGSWTLPGGGSGTNSLGSRSYFDSALEDPTDAPDTALFPTAIGDSVGALGDLDLGGQDAGESSPTGGFEPGSDEFLDGAPGSGDSTAPGSPLGSPLGSTAGSPGGYGGMPMSPMSGMGGGMGSMGQQEKERERTTWLAEEEDVWGTDPECTPAVLGRFDDGPSGSEQTRPAHQPSRRAQPGQSPTRHQVRGRG